MKKKKLTTKPLKITKGYRPILIVLVLGLFVFWFYYLIPSLKVATGYAAKYACSHAFLSNIDKKNVENALDFFPVNLARYSIDEENKKVESSFMGFVAKKTAYYHNNGSSCGCILGKEKPKDLQPNIAKSNSTNRTDSLLWPIGNKIPVEVRQFYDTSKLNQTLDSVITNHPSIYAILIADKNTMIVEKYQDGVNKDTRLLGWSMTKTITNALFGIMDTKGMVNINDSANISNWELDDRKKITINNLLQMSSGLKWTEDYTKLSSVTKMLYLEKDVAAFAERLPTESEPNKTWNYSSGTTNILSEIMRNKFKNYEDYLYFPYKSLFSKINMDSAILETDNAGNYVLSSYCWATARDWTKFGMLYLNNGNWFGEQIFSSEWITYSTAPAPASNGIYGAQLWLNQSHKNLPSVPEDAYFEKGFGGQRILIIPSMDLVITVMSGREKEFDFDLFYSKILECFNSNVNMI